MHLNISFTYPLHTNRLESNKHYFVTYKLILRYTIAIALYLMYKIKLILLASVKASTPLSIVI